MVFLPFRFFRVESICFPRNYLTTSTVNFTGVVKWWPSIWSSHTIKENYVSRRLANQFSKFLFKAILSSKHVVMFLDAASLRVAFYSYSLARCNTSKNHTKIHQHYANTGVHFSLIRLMLNVCVLKWVQKYIVLGACLFCVGLIHFENIYGISYSFILNICILNSIFHKVSLAANVYLISLHKNSSFMYIHGRIIQL